MKCSLGLDLPRFEVRIATDEYIDHGHQWKGDISTRRFQKILKMASSQEISADEIKEQELMKSDKKEDVESDLNSMAQELPLYRQPPQQFLGPDHLWRLIQLFRYYGDP